MESRSVKHRLEWAIGLTFFVLLAEAIGGWLTHSLALLGDAAHMFTDVFSLCLGWWALRLSMRPTTHTKTFGYHRMEIFASLINGLLLFLMAGWILWEAAHRAFNPQPVFSEAVIGVAVVGLLTNLGVLYFLQDPAHDHHHHDLNLKGILYHVIGDTLASVAVIIGAVVMLNTGWYWVDAAVAALVSLILLWGAWNLVSDSIHILLEGVPKGISIHDVQKELSTIPEVRDIHELHIWCICSNIYALSTHALIQDQSLNQTESVREEIRNRLEQKFNITHSTIQLESSPCGLSELTCDIQH